MRTTIDLDDVLLAAWSLARRVRSSVGAVVSELARKGLAGGGSSDRTAESHAFHGFRPLPRRGKPVTNELINRLREDGPY